MSKKLISHSKYVYSLYTNGSVVLVFDYFSDDFKVNETHFNKFFMIQPISFDTKYLLKANGWSFFFQQNNYWVTWQNNFLKDNNYSIDSNNNTKEIVYSIVKKQFLPVKIDSLQIKINSSFFERLKNYFFVTNSNMLSIYNNTTILKIITSYNFKLFDTLFFNF